MLLRVLLPDLECMLEERDQQVVVEPVPWAVHMVWEVIQPPSLI